MNRVIYRVLSFVAVFALIAPTLNIFAPQIATALEGDPIQITTCAELEEISNDLSGNYQLANDIECATTADDNPNADEWVDGVVGGDLIPDSLAGVTNNGYNGFDPIGDPMTPFTGTFDGNNKVISNLWIFRKDTSYVGLFAYTQNAHISNVTIGGSSIVGGYTTGGLVGLAENTTIQAVSVIGSATRAYLTYNGGGLVGQMYHDAENLNPALIINSNVINGAVHGSGNVIGGLVGSMNGGVISGSSSSADIDGGYDIGGAVGYMGSGTINDTSVDEIVVHGDFAEGAIAKSGNNIGGFVGNMQGGAIYNSTSAASVETEGSFAGGFVGNATSYDADEPLIISGSRATGSVNGLGNDVDNGYGQVRNSGAIGGFAGSLNGAGINITDSSATGGVNVAYDGALEASYAVGGFVGSGGCGYSISQSYATGEVFAEHAEAVGGFAGAVGCEGPGGTFTRVYATGVVTGLTDVGGLIGTAFYSDIIQSYASGNVTGNVNVGGLIGRYTSSGPLVSQSFAGGNVEALDHTAGGLFGYFQGEVTDAYARGSVTAPEFVGGFAGEVNNSWSISRAYATGLVSADPGTPYGFIGEDNSSSDITAEGLYYDQQTTGVSTDEYATAKNTNQLKLVANQGTFVGYDFEDTWEFSIGQNGNYPLFRWQNDPVGSILCEEAHMTATTGRIYCEVVYSNGDASRAEPEAWTNPQYRKVGATDWTSTEWVASSVGRYSYTNLEPNTSYEFKMSVANNIIDQDLLVLGTTLSTGSDVDDDNVLDVVENEAPNNGDANNDGMLDAEQQDVTSAVHSVTGAYTILQTDCTSNTSVVTNPESNTNKDPGFEYSAGLMSFTATGCDSVAAITQYFYGNFSASQHVARKYNPNTGAYIFIDGALLSDVTIGGQKVLRVAYSVADNGPLDLNPTTGTITDPSGPALAIGAPNTGVRRIQ